MAIPNSINEYINNSHSCKEFDRVRGLFICSCGEELKSFRKHRRILKDARELCEMKMLVRFEILPKVGA